MYIQEIKRQSDNEIWSSGIIMWTIFAFKNHAECEKWDKLIKGDLLKFFIKHTKAAQTPNQTNLKKLIKFKKVKNGLDDVKGLSTNNFCHA